MTRRSMLLLGSLIAAIAASVWSIATPGSDSIDSEMRHTPSPLTLAAQGSTREAQQVSQPASQSAGPGSAVPESETTVGERQLRSARDDIFAAYSWEPPKAVVTAIKEPPRAPPVPFVFAGRLQADGAPLYILAEGARMHVLAVGEQAGDFRLQQASSAALVFLHVPSNLSATLSIAQ